MEEMSWDKGRLYIDNGGEENFIFFKKLKLLRRKR